MNRLIVLTLEDCPPCRKLKIALDDNRVDYEEIYFTRKNISKEGQLTKHQHDYLNLARDQGFKGFPCILHKDKVVMSRDPKFLKELTYS